MAPNSDFVAPNKSAAIMQPCPRATCPGKCPLKVVVKRYSTVSPARCRVCERKFTYPPGAEKLFEYKDSKPRGGNVPVHANTQSEVNKLKNQLAQSKQHNTLLQQKLAGTGGASSEEQEGGPKAKPKGNLPALQKALASAKEAGFEETSEYVKVLEAKVAEAKAAAEEGKTGDPCKAILGKLHAAQAKQTQLEDQLKKDAERFRACQAKYLEASKSVLALEEEKEQLLKKHGHIPAQGNASVEPPPNLPPAKRDEFKALFEEQLAQLYKNLAAQFLPTPVAPMEQDGDTPEHEGECEQGRTKVPKVDKGPQEQARELEHQLGSHPGSVPVGLAQVDMAPFTTDVDGNVVVLDNPLEAEPGANQHLAEHQRKAQEQLDAILKDINEHVDDI